MCILIPRRLAGWVLSIALSSCVWADADLDRKIEQAAVSSYNFRSVLGHQIKVNAQNGTATLTGRVRDRDEKALAEETVRNLPGVTGVINQIELMSAGPERADGWIALKIRGTLLMRSDVRSADAHVLVRDGMVTLTGVADSPAQKDRAGAYARDVEGVRGVKNELAVRHAAAAAE